MYISNVFYIQDTELRFIINDRIRMSTFILLNRSNLVLQTNMYKNTRWSIIAMMGFSNRSAKKTYSNTSDKLGTLIC